MPKDIKCQTIAEFIDAHGGLDKLVGREVTNGERTWLVGRGAEKSLYRMVLTDPNGFILAKFFKDTSKFLGIPGLRLAPRKLDVYQFAVKVKGRHPEVSTKHFANGKEAIAYYESVTNVGSVEWVQQLTDTKETRTEEPIAEKREKQEN
jgi:hypothetical protein